MFISVRQGQVLEIPADVLITPANPWLSMSSGINGEIVARCGMEIQQQLEAHLRECGLKAVAAGTVVPTSAPGLPFKHLIHAVVTDAFDESSTNLLTRTLISSLKFIDAFTVDSVALPPLATGYGPLSLENFVQALAIACDDQDYYVEKVDLIMSETDDLQFARDFLLSHPFRRNVEIR